MFRFIFSECVRMVGNMVFDKKIVRGKVAPPLVIIFSLFFVLALVANVSAWEVGQPPIVITSPTGSYVEGSTIPFEISVHGTTTFFECDLDTLASVRSFIGNTTINDFFGGYGLGVGSYTLYCSIRSDITGWDFAHIRYTVTAAPPTTLPPSEEIPEFPTAALPAIIAAGGYLAIRRMKNKE